MDAARARALLANQDAAAVNDMVADLDAIALAADVDRDRSPAMRAVHAKLGLYSMIPGFGTPAALEDAGFYFYEGDNGQGWLSLAAAIPFMGVAAPFARGGKTVVNVKDWERLWALIKAEGWRGATRASVLDWYAARFGLTVHARRAATLAYPRVGDYSDAMRRTVFNAAKRDGYVRDPKTREIINFGDDWTMGHRPNYELWKMQDSAYRQRITWEEWKVWQKDPAHYRPETPPTNYGHSEEGHHKRYDGP